MAKKLSEIELEIQSKQTAFFKFIQNALEGEIVDFIESLSKKTDVYIFSGIIRNFFLKNYLIRDIDLVVKSEEVLELISKKIQHRKNSFGGYKLSLDGKNIDLWALDKTWAIQLEGALDIELEKYIPYTAFFNFSSILYSFNRKEFIYTKHFLRFLKSKTLDFVYRPNANYTLCIINTLYYSDTYNLKIANRLFKLIQELHEKGNHDYISAQMKHFNKIIYQPDELKRRLYSRSL